MAINPLVLSEFQLLVSRVSGCYRRSEIIGLEWAWQKALAAHEGQYRLSGEDYCCHLLRGLKTLHYELNLRKAFLLQAYLLHDVIETEDEKRVSEKTGQSSSYQEITDNLGLRVSTIVMVVSKPRPGDPRFIDEFGQPCDFKRQEAYHQQIIQGGLYVHLTKLVDNLDNMRTVCFLPEPKRQRKILESQKFYQPLISGVGWVYPYKAEILWREFAKTPAGIIS
ncbi:MAG: HD domain-containing protein [Candidatus Buchananbacteria bacterium]